MAQEVVGGVQILLRRSINESAVVTSIQAITIERSAFVAEWWLGSSTWWVVLKNSVVRRMASAGQRWQKRMLPLHCRIRTESCVGGVGASKRLSPKESKKYARHKPTIGKLVMVVKGGKRPAAARQNGCCCCVANLQHTRTTSLECVFFTREQVVLLLCPAQQTKCESARVGQAFFGSVNF